MSDPKTIFVVAALIRDAEGRVLLVRKKGTKAFMFPGGKKESEESDIMALARELQEELGCTGESTFFQYIGLFQAPAANEPGYTVEAAVYAVDTPGKLSPQGELEEILWLHPTETHEHLAPLARDHIFPFIAGGQKPAMMG